ncbi:hypothetical protein [Streptomyces sp. NPDC050287]|uniref:hypothetical protein n=1 Tax=Streptomyces sp. NPDC050287 TaxID=3365608 RepID=UPI003788FD60
MRTPLFLFGHESGTAVRTTAVLPAAGVPALWNPAAGGTAPAPVHRTSGRAVQVPLAFAPYEIRIDAVRRDASVPPHLTDATLDVLSVERHACGLRATVETGSPGSHPAHLNRCRPPHRGTVRVDDPIGPRHRQLPSPPPTPSPAEGYASAAAGFSGCDEVDSSAVSGEV